MKDRPPSSYGALYVPPHQRLRSASTIATASATTGSKPINVTTHSDVEKQGPFSIAKVNSNGNSDTVKSFPYLPPHQYQKQQQKENSGLEEAAKLVSDREFEFSAQPSVCLFVDAIVYPSSVGTFV